jgi:hypothetical protein
MIAEQYLCPITGWRVHSEASLDKVNIRHGDFVNAWFRPDYNSRPQYPQKRSVHRSFSDSKRVSKWSQSIASILRRFVC